MTQYRSTAFILCTADLDDLLVERALVAGVAGVLGHDCTAEQLLSVIQSTLQGNAWPAGVGRPALGHAGRQRPLVAITVRQRQVLELLWQGLTHKEIAEFLGRGIKTVEGIVGKLRRAHGLKRGEVAPWEVMRRGRPSGGD
ncbi:MAG TPA: sigma factor-like helix-turn-helix DNA-binding protein [Gemmatimonadales bacterium]|nr:sigma factor-like helix-turn-helix DNA-binding protein [Gemmatimonadales bacterium]